MTLLANPAMPSALAMVWGLFWFVLGASLLIWGAMVCARWGWRTLARLLTAFVIAAAAATPTILASVIVFCGFCCELFWDWVCLL